MNWKIVLFLLSGILLLLGSCKEKQKNQSLFDKYFQVMPIIHLPVDWPQGETWNEIRESYEKKDYKSTIKQLDNLYEPNDSLQAIQKVIKANCLLAINAPIESSIKTIQSIYKEPYPFHGIANWYLGLAYLKNDQTDQARLIIWEIFRKEGTYNQKTARNLIDELLINVNDVNDPR